MYLHHELLLLQVRGVVERVLVIMALAIVIVSSNTVHAESRVVSGQGLVLHMDNHV